MYNKIWVYKNVDDDVTKNIVNKYGISELCAIVLQNRMNIVGGNIDNLFKRLLYNLHNPFLLNDMEAAVSRIEKAIMRNEKITIYGDYDADGVTSTSVLYMFLRDSGANVDYYIPNRFTDGYGMNEESIKRIAENGTNLIITVDNGIAAADEIEYAKSLGLDVIVTDHHECPDVLPNCCAVINPKRADSTYPFSELAGVGVSFKLVMALNKGSLEGIIKKYILLVAVGTVADIVPLTDENRAIVSMGLKMLPYSSNLGVSMLAKVADVDCNNASVADLSFGIVPRINAAGRVDDASVCVKLFSSVNVDECKSISNQLNDYNSKRQEIEKETTEQALEIINENKLYKDNVIVVYGNGWNHGVIGIVASKISEKFYKPSVILTNDDDAVKGSGRSVGGFNLYDSLTYCKEILSRFGGHSSAAGVSLSADNIDKFRKKINEYALEFLKDNVFAEKITIDYVLSAKYINNETINSLDLLSPYGVGNPKPVFAITDAKVIRKQQLSDGKHIKLKISVEDKDVDVIGFSMGDVYSLIEEKDIIDIAGCLDINCFRGMETPQIILKDIKRIRHC